MQAWQPLLADLASRFALVETPVDVEGRGFHLFHPRSIDELLDEDEFNRDGRIPYWTAIWPAGRALAQELLTHTGKRGRLLELGCGVGIGAVAAAAAGFEVTASDYYAEALEFTRLNALRNDVAVPQLMLLDWRDWPRDLVPFETVVAADVMYEPQMCDLVALVLSKALATGGTAIVTDPGRPHSVRFSDACTSRGLTLESATRRLVTDAERRIAIDVYRLRKV